MSAKTAGLVATAVILVWLYGAIHVVYGDRLGLGACWKHGWSLSDTFIDYDRVFSLADRDTLTPKAVDALDKCQLVEDESAWGRDKIILVMLAALGVVGAIQWSTGSWPFKRMRT